MNTKSRQNIIIDDVIVENVEQFIYLGTTVSHTGGTTEGIRRRIGHTRKLKLIWNSSQFGRKKNKIELFRSNVVSVLLHGSETWKIIKEMKRSWTSWILHKCIRNILK